MPNPTARPHLPVAGEPIRSSIAAIAVVSLAIHRPLEAETIAFFLDDENRSNSIAVVSGTTDPDAVLSVTECMAMVASQSPTFCGIVLATVRPNGAPNHPATLPGDIDRWIEACEIAESHGIELIEWFVVGPAGVDCPRDLLGEPQRW
jgi:hypothetical protein